MSTPATTIPQPARITIYKRLGGLLVRFGIPLFIFVSIANEVKRTTPLPGDVAILDGLHHLSSPLLDGFFLTFTALGSAPAIIVITAVAIVWLLKNNHRRDALFVLLAVGGSSLLNFIFKLFFERLRPSLWHQIISEKGYSFPSGHAMSSCSLALTVIILLWPTRWRRLAIITGTVYFVLVGTSRLYLGVHYPSDVIGGWCVSIIWVGMVHRAFGSFSPSKHTEDELATAN